MSNRVKTPVLNLARPPGRNLKHDWQVPRISYACFGSFWGLLTGMLLLAPFNQGQPASDLPPSGRTAAVNGLQLYFEVYGEGEPLLLLHGFTASSQVWKPFVGELAKSFRVIVPDLRGHGRSTNPSKQFTHRLAAQDMYALMDHQGVGKFHAIGFSSGGMVLLHMATQRPERVRSMILVSAAHYFPESARVAMRQSTVDSITAQEWEFARQIHIQGDEQIRMLRRQFHELKDNLDDMNFTPPYLGAIQARTLIVHGDRDPFFSLKIPLELRESIPNSYLWILPNAGHVPVLDQGPRFLQVSLDFLQSAGK